MMETALAVPLLGSQIDTANRLHQRLQQWQLADLALDSLAARFPGFNKEATLLKVVAVNQLYGTRILAVTRLAYHVTEIMLRAEDLGDPELVEQLASFSGRKHLSFASKFAHFFIDKERFPIYDTFAKDMIAYHLGKHGQVHEKEHPYRTFLENLERLKVGAHLSCTNKELDRYLWLAGLYRQWKAKKTEMNVEVADLFHTLSFVEPLELVQLDPLP